MNILGISCFGYNSAACLIRDGEIIAAVQEERFSRKKYDSGFPQQAINWCLDYSGVSLKDVGYIACSVDHSTDKLKIIRRLGLSSRVKIKSFQSQDSFLASAFYPSPFNEAAIMVNATNSGVIFGEGRRSQIQKIKNKIYPPSLGLIYSAVSRYLGFQQYGDEFKVMGLSAYGSPKYKDIILEHREKSIRFLSNPARLPNSEIKQFHMDVAASLQAAVEEKALEMTEHLYRNNKNDNLCLSGDMALNCLINTKILKQGLFKNVWVQPASDNAGRALGAALSVWFRDNERNVKLGKDMMSGSLLGPLYSEDYIESFLQKEGAPYRKLSYAQIPEVTAELIVQGKIIGWFQGRAEFGPRSLGNRSILGDSRDSRMHKKLNLEVKQREPFRPFAPSVLWEKSGDYFELDGETPYMLFTAQVSAEKKNEIPAVVHADGSSRVQTLKKEYNPLYYSLINEFYKKTGCPVIINTSFNSGSEPMVLSPEDAYRCFRRSKIDCLVLGCFLIIK